MTDSFCKGIISFWVQALNLQLGPHALRLRERPCLPVLGTCQGRDVHGTAGLGCSLEAKSSAPRAGGRDSAQGGADVWLAHE